MIILGGMVSKDSEVREENLETANYFGKSISEIWSEKNVRPAGKDDLKL
jgi:hypothetical protein